MTTRCSLSAVNRFVFLRHLSSMPCGREHTGRSWLWPHWNPTTPRISRSRPHCVSLWLDGSIIIPSACHRPHCRASAVSKSWRHYTVNVPDISAVFWKQYLSCIYGVIFFSQQKTSGCFYRNRASACVARPFRTTEGMYQMCCIFSCQST